MEINQELVDKLNGENKKEQTERDENTLRSYLERYDRAKACLEQSIKSNTTPIPGNQTYDPKTLEPIEPQTLTHSQVTAAKSKKEQLAKLEELYAAAIKAGTMDAFYELYNYASNYY